MIDALRELVFLTGAFALAFGAEAQPTDTPSVIICGNKDGRPCTIDDDLAVWLSDADSKGWWWVVCHETEMCHPFGLGGYTIGETARRWLTKHARRVFWDAEVLERRCKNP